MAFYRRLGCVCIATLATITITFGAAAQNAASPKTDKFSEREVFRSAKVPPKQLSLGQAVNWALEHNLTLERASAEIQRREGKVVHADRPFPSNPKVELETASRNPPGANNSVQDYGVRVAQEFWIAGQGGLMAGAAQARVDSAQAQLQYLRTAVAARARRAFLRTLIARESVDTAERAVALTRELATFARRQLEAGKTTQLDVNAAEIAQGQAEAELARAKRDARRRRYELLNILAVDPAYGLSPDGKIRTPELSIPDREKLLEMALRRRQDLMAAASQVVAAREDLRLAKRQVIPNLTVFGFYNRENRMDVAGVGVSLPLPIFHGYGGERQIAAAELSQARIDRESLSLRVRQEVLQAISDYEAAREAFAAIGEGTLAQAEENVRLTKRAFEEGKVGAPAITTVQNNLLDVRNTYLTALGDLVAAVTELERATGGIIRMAGEQDAPADTESEN